MTDIWDEKPDAELIDVVQNIQGYEATEMDDWLEKIKEYWDNTMEMNRKQFHEIGQLEKINRGSKGKAEKFDRYNLHKISLEENGVWGAINKLDAKIETIKKLTEPFIEWGGPCDAFYRVRLHKHPELQEYVSELMKILYPDVQSSEKTEVQS